MLSLWETFTSESGSRFVHPGDDLARSLLTSQFHANNGVRTVVGKVGDVEGGGWTEP